MAQSSQTKVSKGLDTKMWTSQDHWGSLRPVHFPAQLPLLNLYWTAQAQELACQTLDGARTCLMRSYRSYRGRAWLGTQSCSFLASACAGRHVAGSWATGMAREARASPGAAVSSPPSCAWGAAPYPGDPRHGYGHQAPGPHLSTHKHTTLYTYSSHHMYLCFTLAK